MTHILFSVGFDHQSESMLPGLHTKIMIVRLFVDINNLRYPQRSAAAL